MSEKAEDVHVHLQFAFPVSANESRLTLAGASAQGVFNQQIGSKWTAGYGGRS